MCMYVISIKFLFGKKNKNKMTWEYLKKRKKKKKPRK
jgi:hypothetical protein